MIKRLRQGFMKSGGCRGESPGGLAARAAGPVVRVRRADQHPTFRSFLDLVAGYEVMVDFFTNGMHLDDDFRRFLVDRNVYPESRSVSPARQNRHTRRSTWAATSKRYWAASGHWLTPKARSNRRIPSQK